MKKKYLGKWYKIARLGMRFERNLNNVTAHYSLNPDGTIEEERGCKLNYFLIFNHNCSVGIRNFNAFFIKTFFNAFQHITF